MSVRFSLHLRFAVPLGAQTLWPPSALNQYGFSSMLKNRRLEASGSKAVNQAESLAAFRQ